MIKRSGYHHVALRARDLDKTIEFYQALGCELLREWGEKENRGCMLDVGGDNILEVFANSESEKESKPYFKHIALRSDNVEEDFSNALEHGAEAVIEPSSASLGSFKIKMAFVKGLNGETIEFFTEV